MGLLDHLHSGACMVDDIDLLDTVTLDLPLCLPTNLNDSPWNDTIFITSRNAAHNEWNAEALKHHCLRTGNILYKSPAKDYRGKTREEMSMREKLDVVGMTKKKAGCIPDMLEIAIRMKAMVTVNIAMESDLANGTRGTIEDLILNPQEQPPQPDEDNIINLMYPPALILFWPLNQENMPTFEGLGAGLLPIVPSEVTFPVKQKKTKTVHRIPLAICSNGCIQLHTPQRSRTDPGLRYCQPGRSTKTQFGCISCVHCIIAKLWQAIN